MSEDLHNSYNSRYEQNSDDYKIGKTIPGSIRDDYYDDSKYDNNEKYNISPSYSKSSHNINRNHYYYNHSDTPTNNSYNTNQNSKHKSYTSDINNDIYNIDDRFRRDARPYTPDYNSSLNKPNNPRLISIREQINTNYNPVHGFTPSNNTPSNNTPSNNTPSNGTPSNGTPSSDIPSNNTSSNRRFDNIDTPQLISSTNNNSSGNFEISNCYSKSATVQERNGPGSSWSNTNTKISSGSKNFHPFKPGAQVRLVDSSGDNLSGTHFNSFDSSGQPSTVHFRTDGTTGQAGCNSVNSNIRVYNCNANDLGIQQKPPSSNTWENVSGTVVSNSSQSVNLTKGNVFRLYQPNNTFTSINTNVDDVQTDSTIYFWNDGKNTSYTGCQDDKLGIGNCFKQTMNLQTITNNNWVTMSSNCKPITIPPGSRISVNIMGGVKIRLISCNNNTISAVYTTPVDPVNYPATVYLGPNNTINYGGCSSDTVNVHIHNCYIYPMTIEVKNPNGTWIKHGSIQANSFTSPLVSTNNGSQIRLTNSEQNLVSGVYHVSSSTDPTVYFRSDGTLDNNSCSPMVHVNIYNCYNSSLNVETQDHYGTWIPVQGVAVDGTSTQFTLLSGSNIRLVSPDRSFITKIYQVPYGQSDVPDTIYFREDGDISTSGCSSSTKPCDTPIPPIPPISPIPPIPPPSNSNRNCSSCKNNGCQGGCNKCGRKGAYVCQKDSNNSSTEGPGFWETWWWIILIIIVIILIVVVIFILYYRNSSSKKNNKIAVPNKQTPYQQVQNQPVQYQQVQNQPIQYQQVQNQPIQYPPAQNQPLQYPPAQNQPLQYPPAQNQPLQYQPIQTQGNVPGVVASSISQQPSIVTSSQNSNVNLVGSTSNIRQQSIISGNVPVPGEPIPGQISTVNSGLVTGAGLIGLPSNNITPGRPNIVTTELNNGPQITGVPGKLGSFGENIGVNINSQDMGSSNIRNTPPGNSNPVSTSNISGYIY